jgi:hypothetical protein
MFNFERFLQLEKHADNVSATPGTGVTFASDDIGGIQHPRVKVQFGVDGAATDASASNPLPVVQTGTPALPTGAATETTLAAVKTAVELIDNAISGSEMQVDVVAPLPAGTNNIGDVDVLSCALPTGAATEAKQDTQITSLQLLDDTVETNSGNKFLMVGGRHGPGAGAVAEMAVDSSGNVQVDVLTSVLPSGAATSALQTSSEALLTTIDADTGSMASSLTSIAAEDFATETTLAAVKTAVEIIDNAISGSEMQVDIVAALPAGTNNIGDVDVLSLPALAAGTNTVGNVGLATRTTGGLSMSSLVSAASTNATVVKASAGHVYSIQASNKSATLAYLKLYNKATSPTVGTDVPVKRLIIPANTTGAGFILDQPMGLAFSAGIAFAITALPTTADTTAVTADDFTVDIDYA